MNADQRADKLLADGNVNIIACDPDHIEAEVTGEGGVYLTILRVERGVLVAACNCEHGRIHPYKPQCAHTKSLRRVFHRRITA